MGSRIRSVLMVGSLAAATAVPLAGQAPAANVSDVAHSATIGSVAGTLAPLAIAGLMIAGGDGDESAGVMLGIGYVVGPSVGYFIAGHPSRAIGGMLLRAGVAAGMGSIAAESWNCGCDDGVGWFLALGAIGVGSMIYDVAHVGAYVRQHDVRIESYVDPEGRVGLAVRL